GLTDTPRNVSAVWQASSSDMAEICLSVIVFTASRALAISATRTFASSSAACRAACLACSAAHPVRTNADMAITTRLLLIITRMCFSHRSPDLCAGLCWTPRLLRLQPHPVVWQEFDAPTL